jgi:hypothetical protein
MADSLTGNQGVQLGLETTIGTAVAANKKFLLTDIRPAVKADTKNFKSQGSKFPSTVVTGKESVEAKVEGQGNYMDLTYLLASLVNKPTPVQQGGTAAQKWTFTSNPSAPDTTASYTIEQGDATRARRFAGAVLAGLTMAFSRDNVKYNGTMMGFALEDAITMTASPTTIAKQLLLPTHVDYYLAATYAGLSGATVLGRTWASEFALTDRFQFIYPQGRAYGTGPAGIVENSNPKLNAKLTMGADAIGMGPLTNLRASSTQFLRIKATGPLIASTYYYTLQIDVCVGVGGVSDFKDQEGVFALEWQLEGVVDDTWGKAFQIELTNSLAAL